MATLTFDPPQFTVLMDPAKKDAAARFTIIISNAGAPVSAKDVTVKMYDVKDIGKNYPGNASASKTNATGQSIVSFYNINNATDYTCDIAIGGDSGTMTGTQVVLTQFDLDAFPLVIEDPGTITFTATVLPSKMAAIPDTATLSWTSADAKRFEDLTDDNGDGSKTEFKKVTLAITDDDFTDSLGEKIDLTVSAEGVGQTVPLVRSISAQLGYPLPPIYVPGADTGNNTIDDNIISIYANEGIPWLVRSVTGVDATRTHVTLWASATEIKTLQEFKNAGSGLTELQIADLSKVGNTVLSVDVTNPVFQQRSATIYVFYTLTNYITDDGASIISASEAIQIYRENLTTQIDPTLVPLTLSQDYYGLEDVAQKRTMVATFTFPKQRQLYVNDVISIYMDLVGVNNDNLGVPTTKALRPYKLTQPDLDNGVPLVFPGATVGDSNGFTYERLGDVDGSDGEVYYTVTSDTTGKVSRSSSREVYVSAVPPH